MHHRVSSISPTILEAALSNRIKTLLLTLLLLLPALRAHADNTELDVYRGEIADEGESNIDFAANIAKTSRHSDGRGASVFQAVTEYSYGLDDSWEVGLKLPVYAMGGAWKAGGLLSEIKYVAPHEKYGWYWGAEFEIGYESIVGEDEQWTLETVPIIGWRNRFWDISLNPGVTITSGGEQRGTVIFEPAGKIAYATGDKCAVGIEYFSEAGPIGHLLPARERNDLLFLTLDTRIGKSAVNIGLGHGVGAASPGLALKTVIDLEFD